jgi:hypothetical protein
MAATHAFLRLTQTFRTRNKIILNVLYTIGIYSFVTLAVNFLFLPSGMMVQYYGEQRSFCSRPMRSSWTMKPP